MKRRDFVKVTTCGLVAVAVGSRLRLPPAQAQSIPTINLTMTSTDTFVQMVDTASVPHWLYEVDGVRAFPGPAIFAFEDEDFTISIQDSINNGVDRGFAIVGGPSVNFPSGGSGSLTIGPSGTTKLAPGTYLYKDPSLHPISRVMGLHGALVILPGSPAGPFPITNPYNPAASSNVTALFTALGVPVGPSWNPADIFPGQKWFATTDGTGYPTGNFSDEEHHHYFVEVGPQSTVFERFLYRSRIWVHSTIDPVMNQKVVAGDIDGTPITNQTLFVEKFLLGYDPQYFTLNGRSGGYAAHSPDVTIVGTVGEPHLIRNLNAGLATHSPHLHANHFYVTAVNNVVGGGGVYFGNPLGSNNVVFLDAMTIGPEDRVDWLVPFIRPPDIPRVLDNGGNLLPLSQLIPEELNLVLIVPQDPLTYPMHSHMELDQTSTGGNYPQGAVTQFEIIGEFGEHFSHWPQP